MIWLRTILFAVLVPGTVLGLVPYRLAAPPGGPVHPAGIALIVPGVLLMAACFADFARRGRGTPAPVDPPVRLVIAGPYRLVRNPMYVGGLLILAGEAVLWASPRLLAYAAGFWLLTHLFVVAHEEPALAARFGDEYAAYRSAVPRWIPRKMRGDNHL